MKIAELTTRQVPAIASGATLQEAALAMRTAHTGILPVVENGRLLGTLSVRDLALQGCGGGLDPRSETVAGIFERDPIACPGDIPLRSALELMRARQLAWLVVLDTQGLVMGAVSLVELLDVLEGLIPEETDGPEPDYVRQVRGGDGE